MLSIFLVAGLLQCGDEVVVDGCFPISRKCATEATARDLTGLDGCGLVLELNDGTKLIPERRVYIQAPTPEDDPLYYFDLKAGDHVMIGFYEPGDEVNACMAGKMVFITCITYIKDSQ